MLAEIFWRIFVFNCVKNICNNIFSFFKKDPIVFVVSVVFGGLSFAVGYLWLLPIAIFVAGAAFLFLNEEIEIRWRDQIMSTAAGLLTGTFVLSFAWLVVWLSPMLALWSFCVVVAILLVIFIKECF